MKAIEKQEAYIVKAVDEFIKWTDVVDMKSTLYGMLSDTFAAQKEDDRITLSHSATVLFDFRMLCQLLDHIQEYRHAFWANELYDDNNPKN